MNKINKKFKILGEQERPLKVALAYLFFSIFWLFFSTQLFNIFFVDFVNNHYFVLFHNLFYFLITSYLIYFIVKKMLDDEEKSKKSLKEVENRFETLTSTTKDAIVFIDEKNEITEWNKGACKIFGYSEKEMLSKDIYKTVFNQIESKIIKDFIINKKNKKNNCFKLNPFKKNGEQITVEVTIHSIYKNEKRYIGFLIVDLTEKLLIEKKDKLWRKIFENSSECILVFNSNKKVVSCNKSFLEKTGYVEEEVLNNGLSIFLNFQLHEKIYQNIKRGIFEKGSWCGEILTLKKDSTTYPVWLTVSSIMDETETFPEYYVVNFSDLTEFKEKEDQLKIASKFDELTGLPDKRSLLDIMKNYLENVKSRKEKLLFIGLDLDHFQQVNDTYNHLMGDLLIKKIAREIKNKIGSNDVLIRSSGDEFIILHQLKNKENCDEYLDRIRDIFQKSFLVKEKEFNITASIGAAIFPKDAKNEVELLKNGDAAMHCSKNSGKNMISYYNQELTKNAKNRFFIKTALQKAIESGKDEFEIFYQPQYKIKNGESEIIGFEALIRWFHPERGVISPGDFIPVSEETGLISPIGYMVLNKVCHQIKEWKEKKYKVPKISINVSPRQLKEIDFIDRVKFLLNEYKIKASDIEFEITETFIMEDTEKSILTLQEIFDLGIDMSIDDFGAGYSSFGYLKKLPIKKLKIDQAFIRDLPNNNEDISIVKSMINLAKNMNLEIIAEGVENKEQEVFLVEQGCVNMQGFYYNRPLTKKDAEGLVEKIIH